ncbi:MAG: flavocytochrome c, partial [Aigarchaeota archaeon]|nr:flavocytochrome c [Aigarchaeota archaeon]
KTVTTTKTETKVEEAKPWLPAKWDEEADVVIVGSGGAGLAAAITAHDEGAKVLIVEKMPQMGICNTAVSGGIINAWSSKLKLHEKQGIKDSLELQYQDILRSGDYMGDPELIRTLVENAPSTIDFLVDIGVPFGDTLTMSGGQSVPRTFRIIGSGAALYKPLREAVQKRGIKVLLEHKVTKIIREETDGGRVLGVKAETTDGKTKYIRAKKAVILAAGGFCQSELLLKRHAPRFAGFPSTNAPGTTTGEVLVAAMDVGAAVRGMDYVQLWPMCDYETGSLTTIAAGTETGTGIMVNINGKRFVEEMERRDVRRDAVLAQPGGFAFAIVDHKQLKTITAFGDPEKIIADQIKRGVAFKADTIRELAILAGIDPTNLVETVNNWNKYVDEGYDPEFKRRDLPTKKGDPMLKIDTPPFYAIKGRPSLHHTMGGLHINTKAQVLDVEGKVIPGLYAAGEITGGIHGTNRIGGNALLDIITFGRIAGKNAAREVSA